jgi:acetolactate synthase-1/2/3 large subunit
MNTYELCAELSRELGADDILIVGSSSMAVRIFGKHYTGKARMMQSNAAQGSMGAMIPVSIGVSLASGKRLVCVDGDGSFTQNIQELEVVRRIRLNITYFVIDNGGYASIRNSEMRWFGRTSDGVTLPDIVAVARGFGLYSCNGDGFGFIADCLHKWRGPQVIRIPVPHDEQPPARDNA